MRGNQVDVGSHISLPVSCGVFTRGEAMDNDVK